MAGPTRIEWTDSSWNPVTGCTKVSPGCKHCYAERMATRLRAMGQRAYRNGFQVTLHPELLRAPLRWRRPRTIFVNSMSDLFHESIPFSFLEQVFAVMEEASWHSFQILTKRSRYLRDVAPALRWPRNVWMGVSVESNEYSTRIDDLRTVPAAVRFLSLEPLLGPIPELGLHGIDWVIVGGESGPGARPMQPEWVREIRDRCLAAGCAFFFKQWGGVNKKRAGRLIDGRTWDDTPVSLLRRPPAPDQLDDPRQGSRAVR